MWVCISPIFCSHYGNLVATYILVTCLNAKIWSCLYIACPYAAPLATCGQKLSWLTYSHIWSYMSQTQNSTNTTTQTEIEVFYTLLCDITTTLIFLVISNHLDVLVVLFLRFVWKQVRKTRHKAFDRNVIVLNVFSELLRVKIDLQSK